MIVLVHKPSAAQKARNSNFKLGESQKVKVCPPAKSISPCLCSVISKGKTDVYNNSSTLKNPIFFSLCNK